MEEGTLSAGGSSDVLRNKPEGLFISKNIFIEYEDGDNYSLRVKIGKGFSSIVYKALHYSTQRTVVCKVYKPQRIHLLQQEVTILRMLEDGENIIQLLGIVYFRDILAPGLVLEKLSCAFDNIHTMLTENLIKHYGIQMLKALDYCHSKRIIHHDVKPANMVVDLERKILKLIDWGSAIFYKPDIKNSRLACTPGYTAPELLICMDYYNYSIDIWSAGCVFAEMIFRKGDFFYDKDEYNDLKIIVKVLGSNKFREWCLKYDIHLETQKTLLFLYDEIPFNHFTNRKNKCLVNNKFLNLIQNLLCFDHEERLTAHQALNHNYFVD